MLLKNNKGYLGGCGCGEEKYWGLTIFFGKKKKELLSSDGWEGIKKITEMDPYFKESNYKKRYLKVRTLT